MALRRPYTRISARQAAWRALLFVREVGDTASILWWRFFDWLAQVDWRKLVVIWVLALLFGQTPIGLPSQAFAFIALSFGLKVLAGAKRKAELEARQAKRHADVETLQRHLAEAQMATLQAQVEPHFLFNTLALIGQLIETDPAEAARIHMHLIDYLRATLPQLRAKGGGTLGKQIELARAYLAIMQARMKERLTVSIAVPPALNDAQFPPMMLLSLIENAIKHGLEPTIAGGHVAVRAMLAGDLLRVDVQDTGAGFGPYSGEGVGLANIRERLALLHGARAQLLVEAPSGGGAHVAIVVPYLPATPNHSPS
jgi:LytS/YehU family sensor histidine kinase